MRVLKFGASWCDKCSILSNLIKESDLDLPEIEEIDLDEEPELAEKYGVQTLPTICFVDDLGKLLKKSARATETKQPLTPEIILKEYNKLREEHE